MSSSIYASWLAETQARKNNYYYKQISFANSIQNINIGDTVNITDTNGILSNYEEFSKTENGVTFSHYQGSNDLMISTNSNSKNSTFNTLNYGIYELMPDGSHYNANTMSSFICINFGSSTTQNLIFSNRVDPVFFKFDVNVISGKFKDKRIKQTWESSTR